MRLEGKWVGWEWVEWSTFQQRRSFTMMPDENRGTYDSKGGQN